MPGKTNKLLTTALEQLGMDNTQSNYWLERFQQQQNMAVQNNLGYSLGNAYGNLSGSIGNNPYVQIGMLPNALQYNPPTPIFVSEVKEVFCEFEWLKSRVDDICWKN